MCFRRKDQTFRKRSTSSAIARLLLVFWMYYDTNSLTWMSLPSVWRSVIVPKLGRWCVIVYGLMVTIKLDQASLFCWPSSPGIHLFQQVYRVVSKPRRWVRCIQNGGTTTNVFLWFLWWNLHRHWKQPCHANWHPSDLSLGQSSGTSLNLRESDSDWSWRTCTTLHRCTPTSSPMFRAYWIQDLWPNTRSIHQ